MNMLLNYGGTHFVLMRTLHLHTLLQVPLYLISEKAHRNYLCMRSYTLSNHSWLLLDLKNLL